ncbi:protein kinase domain-containing protein [Streptomyces sp. Marseille-Q5077]|uniref:protein kinase domain-containing protein n=1 Tax=Streptomyces sp. Marseille-Q5077 TaxID=3418995 RepID=UPI003D042DA8
MPADGVVHRYLKPAKVILAPDGARVLDFGIAHVAHVADGTAVIRPGTPTGTPGWLSPEYHRDATAGRTEIFAWGVLYAFMATGCPPSARAFSYWSVGR